MFVFAFCELGKNTTKETTRTQHPAHTSMRSVVVIVLAAVIVVTSLAVVPAAAYSRAVGINAVDILWQTWSLSPFGAGGQEAALSHLKAACTANLTGAVVRFAASPFWPVQWNSTYFANKAAFWSSAASTLRNAVAICPEIRFLPSLFWQWWTVPDLNGEPLGAMMRNGSSKSRAFFVKYVNEFSTNVLAAVPRRNFAGVELGNELNLLGDLDLAHTPTHPSLGQPAFRTAADNFSTDEMVAFESWLAAAIRGAAPGMPVSTGHAIPRHDAEHLRRSYHAPARDWTPDSKQEYEANVAYTTRCCEIASFHYYNGSASNRPWAVAGGGSDSVLMVTARAVAQAGKRLYVGEFGDPDAGLRLWSHHVLDELKAVAETVTDVLCSVWVWEFYQFSQTTPAPFSVIPGRDDDIIAAFQLFNKQ